jgi:hypothetical protein
MDDQQLLEGLVGSWRITGTMRGQALAQNAKAHRAFNGAFVEMRITEGTPLIDGKPYEAVYFIGSPTAGRFVMTLVDVFGAGVSPIPGLGRRDGDAIVFEFAYSNGPWTWRWTPSAGGWDHEQTYLESGETKVFATKRMERVR